MNNSEMFKNKTLKITDYFAPYDIPKVYHYFDYYNLATLKDVTYYDHLEPEYNAEDKPFYGFAIIEIEEWHNNNSAKFFYNAISENKGKMVYDDPNYWDIEFDNVEEVKEVKEVEEVEEVKEVKEEKNEINKPNINLKVEVNDETNEEYNLNENLDEHKHEHENENEDEDYVFSNEDDSYHEFYKKYDNSPQKNKKRKYSAIIENLKAENNDLRELLIKKQKNYKKNNKKKDNKPSWYRRLRVKVVE